MEIRQLEYFLMVSRVNSFTRAAECLYVSQPAVTNAVRSLDDELGIQLFDRSQKQALLTTEGKIFFAHVEQIMNGISNTLKEINSLKNLGTGIVNIRLTTLGGIPSCVFLLKEFVEGYPNIKISVREDETEKLQKLLVEDKLDFALVFSGKEKSTLAYLELPPQELALCCNRRHRFRRQNVLPLEELRNESLILPKVARDFFVDSNILQNVVAEISHVQTIKINAFDEGYRSLKPNRVYCVIQPESNSSKSSALKGNKLVAIIAGALLGEEYAVQLVARLDGNDLEMEKDWEMMTEFDFA